MKGLKKASQNTIRPGKKVMNCTQVEKLLALYTEGDAGDAPARAITEHLQSCDGCRRLADEFAASQSILRLHTPPEFDAAFFDGIRQSVLREITQAPARSRFISSFTQLFAPRSFALAASLALLITASALFIFQLSRRNAEQAREFQADNKTGASLNAAPGKSLTMPSTAENNTTSNSSESNNPGHLMPKVLMHTQTKQARLPSPTTPTRVRHPIPSPSTTTGATVEQASHAPLEPLSPAPDAVASVDRKMMRIELQTSDPNIRIIWLSPQTTDTLSTKK